MVHRDSPLQHHLLQVAVTQGIPQIPPDAKQNDVGLEVAPLKGMLGVHGRGGLGERTKYKYYLYQTTTSFCNTTPCSQSAATSSIGSLEASKARTGTGGNDTILNLGESLS